MNRLDEPAFIAVSKPMVTEFGIHYRLESCATEQTISLAICEERKYGSIFLLFPLNRIFKQTQKEWPLNRCFRRIFFLFLRYLDVLQKEGGLIWHGTRLVGVYLMLSGWSADRRTKRRPFCLPLPMTNRTWQKRRHLH